MYLNQVASLFFAACALGGFANHNVSYDELNFPEEEVREGRINPYTHLEVFIEHAKQAASLLPEIILEELVKLKENRTESGYLLFKGLPVDFNLRQTPGLDFSPIKDSFIKNSFVSEFCLTLFGSVLGEPFNYIQEEDGNIFRNVRPTKKNEHEQTSDGSKVDLELHTETAFHPFKPDYLMLYCLRGDKNKKAFTLISSLKKVLRELDPNTIAELKKKQYLTGIDRSFGNTDKTKYCKDLISVLDGTNNDQTITYDLDLMTGVTREAEKALDLLKEAILTVQEAILLEPGDLLIFDNRRVIHGRTAFDAFFDGYDRWLQRVYLSKDPEFVENISSLGRVIKQEF